MIYNSKVSRYRVIRRMTDSHGVLNPGDIVSVARASQWALANRMALLHLGTLEATVEPATAFAPGEESPSVAQSGQTTGLFS